MNAAARPRCSLRFLIVSSGLAAGKRFLINMSEVWAPPRPGPLRFSLPFRTDTRNSYVTERQPATPATTLSTSLSVTAGSSWGQGGSILSDVYFL